MNKKELRLSTVLAVLTSLIAAFFDVRVSAGIILGFMFSLAHLYLLTKHVDSMLYQDKASIFWVIISSVFRYAMIALPLLIAIKFSAYFNVFGAFFGFLLYKIVLVIIAVINKE